MPELLLEIGCEELPASACREALAQAPMLVADALADLEIASREPRAFVTPRRIAVAVSGVPAERAARTREHMGPTESAAFGADGAPTRAAEGFARSRGVGVDELQVREHGGRRVVVAVVGEAAVPAAELVPEVAARLVNGLRFAKSMRWGEGDGLRFARPVRWLVAMLDDQAVSFELHGLAAGRETRGHRFLGGPVRLASAGEYLDALRGAGVVANPEERRADILSGLDDAAAALGCVWRDPGEKLEEVLFLAEWPNVLSGRFSEEHLRLPTGVLVTAMQSHQRYFPLESPDGQLRAAFLAVSNGDPAHSALIVRGNEDWLEGRLQDAAFSFDRDRESGVAALDGRLSSIVFHARLGSMADKRDRLVELAPAVADGAGLPAEVVGTAREAARIAKADQAAILVAEFPELEGYVGGEYARLEGAPEPVWRAVAEQYRPVGHGTQLPETSAGAALAVADKLDGVVGAFLTGDEPTGSRDPYAVRRAATGVIRILLARDWDLELEPLAERAAEELARQGADMARGVEEALAGVNAFVADRLAFQLRDEGVGPEATAAAIGAGVGGPVATAAWARQIDAQREEPSFRESWTAAIRASRLAAGHNGGVAARPPLEPAEQALAEAIAAAEPKIAAARDARRLSAALEAGAPLAAAIDRFLTDVLVNAEDPVARERRLGLVGHAAATLAGIADFSQLSDGGR